MNILAVNLPYAGHTNPTLPLTAELVKRGHRVTYINAEVFRQPIEATGARFVPYPDFPVTIGEEQKKRTSFRKAYDTVLSVGQSESFDLLLYEMFFHPGAQAARTLGLPCVRQFSQPAWSDATWQAAPAMFRLSARLIDAQVLSKRDAVHMGLTYTSLHDGVINEHPDLNIVYLPEAFQPQRESFDDSYLFIVPKQNVVSGNVPIPYDAMKRPIVYISLGSLISNKGFCKECIRAFGNKDCFVILSTGKVAPESLGKIPSNLYVYSFVPQVEVLQHADVFLTHCGMNSVNEALCAGVPMVAMPFINDQMTNARQLVRLGLARQVRSFPSSGRELYRAVCQVSRDEGMKQRAKAFREEIKRQKDWDSVIARMEETVESKHN